MGQLDDTERAEIEQAKRASVGQLLFRAARLFNEQALARIRERTGWEIRPAHTTLFPHIDLEGTRLTVLARRLGTSKQAVGQLVGELEQMGAVERVPDPNDGRAKLIRFARRRGKLSVLDGLAVLVELEQDLRGRMGERPMDDLADLLRQLLTVLEE